MANYQNPSPDKRLEVLYRQTYNTLGAIDATGLTQDNIVGNVQKTSNSRLVATNPPKGILAGSVVAVTGAGSIGPCVSDSSTAHDTAVGIAVNDAVGNPYESASAVASGKCVYAHGTGTVIRTSLYEMVTPGNATIAYVAGDTVFASSNGLLSKYATTKVDGSNLGQIVFTNVGANATPIGIILDPPASGNGYYMTVQLKI